MRSGWETRTWGERRARPILDAEITFDEFDDAGVHDLDCFSGDLPTQTDAHVAFTIHFQADGWDIQGQGVAPFCPTFNFICP